VIIGIGSPGQKIVTQTTDSAQTTPEAVPQGTALDLPTRSSREHPGAGRSETGDDDPRPDRSRDQAEERREEPDSFDGEHGAMVAYPPAHVVREVERLRGRSVAGL